MIKRLLTAIILVSCMVLLSTSATTTSPSLKEIEKLIPESAMFYLHIGDPDKFISDVETVIDMIGLKKQLGKKTLKGMMKELMEAGETGLKFEALNLKKPWGLAFLPSGKSDPVVLALVPLNDPRKNFKAFSAFVTASGIKSAKLAGDYAVLLSEAIKENIPAQKHVNLSELNSFPKSSASFWMDVRSVLKTIGGADGSWKEEIFEDAFDSEDTKPALKKLLSGFADVIEEIEIVTMNLQLEKTGLTARYNASVAKGKSIDKMFKNLGKVKGISAYTKYIPSKYLFSVSFHADPDIFEKLFMSIYEPFIDAVEISEADKAELSGLIKSAFGARSSEMSMAFDMDMDLGFLDTEPAIVEPETVEPPLEGMDPELEDFESYEYDLPDSKLYNEDKSAENVKKLLESMAFNLVYVMEAKDKELFRRSYEEMLQSKTFQKLMDALSADTLAGFKFRYTYTRDKRFGSLTCDELGFSAEGTVPASEDTEALAALTTFLSKQKAVLHFAKNKCYMVMGKDAESLIAKVVSADAFPNPNIAGALAANPQAKKIYDDSNIGGHFSMLRLLEILKTSKELSAIPQVKETGKEAGIIGGMKYANGRFESTSFWNMDEMKSFFKAISSQINLGEAMSM